MNRSTPAALARILLVIEDGDKAKDYDIRNRFVLKAVAVADSLGYKTGFRIDPQEPEWPVAFIELPTGQVSWHLPQHEREWDGHTDEEKKERCKEFVRQFR